MDDQIGDKGISYDLSNTTAKSPVSIDGGRIRFALPQPFEQALSITVEFDGATLSGILLHYRVLLHERVKLVTHLGGLRWRSVTCCPLKVVMRGGFKFVSRFWNDVSVATGSKLSGRWNIRKHWRISGDSLCQKVMTRHNDAHGIYTIC